MRLLIPTLTAILVLTPAHAETVTAVLEPWRIVEIRSTVNGRLAAVIPEDGETITKGSLLARIDAHVQEARVRLAEVIAEAQGASMRAARLLEQAETRRDQIATARKKGAAQAWELVAAEQAVALAEADRRVAADDLARREAELELERATLAEFTVIAPFDATALEVMVDPGEIVDTRTVLMEIGSVDILAATAFVPVEWAAGLTPGTVLPAETETGDALNSTVTSIDPRVEPVSQTVRVNLRVENADGRVRPGTTLVIGAP